MVLDETSIPVSEPVRGACEILGLDSLCVANEGKVLAVVTPDMAEQVLRRLRKLPLGTATALIGEVSAESPAHVLVRGLLGVLRVLDEPSGAPLPRIC